MKSWLIIIGLILVRQSVSAQFFSQKTAQLRRLAEQVAALHVYGEFLGKGYKIARKGLNTVQDIKNGDFKLHDIFFKALGKVNPNVGRYAATGRMISLQVAAVQISFRTLWEVRKSGYYSEDDLLYFQQVFDRILEACFKTLEELAIFTSDGRLQLTDDERIKRIDNLHVQMKDHYQQVRIFANEVISGAMSRRHEQQDLQRARILHQINDEP